jgi:hypothetical protein
MDFDFNFSKSGVKRKFKVVQKLKSNKKSNNYRSSNVWIDDCLLDFKKDEKVDDNFDDLDDFIEN